MHEDELDRLVEMWTIQRDAREVMGLRQGVRVAAGVIQSGKDLLESNPQVKARGHYVRMKHPEAGEQTLDGVRIRDYQPPQGRYVTHA